MIDVMENKILGPAIRKGLEQGLKQGFEQGFEQGFKQGFEEGWEQGRLQGKQELFRDLLIEKFGPLPEWASQRLKSATVEELKSWAGRFVTSTSLEDSLG